MKSDIAPGTVFGYWTVLGDAPNMIDARGKQRGAFYVRCICGAERVQSGVKLRSQGTKSCGCMKVSLLKKSRTGYGIKTPGELRAYRSWGNMIERCSGAKGKSASRHYKDRGITVCDRWRASFANFLEDMGERPEGYTLERKDNDRGYEPGNCVWATRSEQNRNQRRTIRVTYKGQATTLRALADHLGIPFTTLHGRYRIRGRDLDAAVNFVKKKRGPKPHTIRLTTD